jgi:carbon storage regulator CsrA
MLVLKRRVGESLHIGDDIIVKVVQATDEHVKIAITAP